MTDKPNIGETLDRIVKRITAMGFAGGCIVGAVSMAVALHII